VNQRPIRIATRASRLALWQAHHVAALLKPWASSRPINMVHVKTAGDLEVNEPLKQFGGQGLFTKDVQKAILNKDADLAVHSLKDLPTENVPGLTLAAVPVRGESTDCLVLSVKSDLAETAKGETPLDHLPPQARIGTGSPRRGAQLLYYRSDFALLEIRGNVETRIRKLDQAECDAIVLAEAGLRRLGLEARISQRLDPPLMFPAPGQGALGIECRTDDQETLSLLHHLDDPATSAAVHAERAVLSRLRAGCRAPLGVATYAEGGQLSLEAVVLSHDGRERLIALRRGPLSDPDSLGNELADELLRQGAAKLIDEARHET